VWEGNTPPHTHPLRWFGGKGLRRGQYRTPHPLRWFGGKGLRRGQYSSPKNLLFDDLEIAYFGEF